MKKKAYRWRISRHSNMVHAAVRGRVMRCMQRKVQGNGVYSAIRGTAKWHMR